MIVAGALIIGITLGLLGSGGSTITVPVLIYLVGHTAKQSIAESLAIVGLISVVAAVPYARSKQIDWQIVVLFGLPGIAGTLVGAWMGGYSSDTLQLIVFGGVLVAAAVAMLRNISRAAESSDKERHSNVQIAIEGMLTGLLTGFVGVGGGFLIVPALLVFAKLPIRQAMGTSLVIITLSSTIGFLKYQHHLTTIGSSIDSATVLLFVSIGIVGSLVGKAINEYLDQKKLKVSFAIFLVLIGALIILQEGSKLLAGRGQNQASATVKLDEYPDSAQQQSMTKEQCDATKVLL